MFHSFEGFQTLTNLLVAHSCQIGGDACCQRVVEVVLAAQCQLFLFHIERRGSFNHVFILIHIANHAVALELAERTELCLDVVFLQFSRHNRIIVPEDEGIVWGLVLDDAHLRIHIVLHLEVVAVEVVGRDVHQHGDVGLEVIHVVQLETAQLNHVVIMLLLSHLQRQTVANITGQTHIVTRILQDVVDERRGGGLTVRTRDANHLGMGVSACKLNLRNDGDVLLLDLQNHRRILGNAWALDDLVGIEDQFLRMMSLFPNNLMTVQEFLILIFDGRHVADEHIKAFFLGQHSGSSTTFGCTQNYNSFHLVLCFISTTPHAWADYLIFNVMMVMAASRMVTIQNLVVIMDSNSNPCGRLMRYFTPSSIL